MVKFLSIEDLELEERSVFLRVDMNSPVDPSSGRIMDLSRIKEAAETINALSGTRLVVATHQGRVGRYDYVPVREHAQELEKILNRRVEFTEDVMGPTARDVISRLQKDEILLLDNLRFVAEENSEFSHEDAVKTILVQRLHRLFDMTVLDAFSIAHRAHPSIVGFAQMMPACAGKVVVRELKGVESILEEKKQPFILVFGGVKVEDRLDAMDEMLAGGKADKILLCGVIANVFLKAKRVLKRRPGLSGEDKVISKASALLSQYGGKIELPVDLAVHRNDGRTEVSSDEVSDQDRVLDLGAKTIEKYSKLIDGAEAVLLSGPPGAFEVRGFDVGTQALLRAVVSSSASSIMSGGHLSAALEKYGLKEKVGHISTAGGALVTLLSGRRMPLIEALERAAQRAST